MSENFNGFLNNRVEELKNKKNTLELEIEKAKDINYKLDKKLEEFNKNTNRRKKLHLILGLIGTIILNFITFKTINTMNIDLSKFGIIVFSLIESLPIIVGIHNSSNSIKEIEKEMNIELGKLNDEIEFNNTLIDTNLKKISKLDIILNEASYLMQVSNIYESDNMKKLIESENSLKDYKMKDKTKTLKLY